MSYSIRTLATVLITLSLAACASLPAQSPLIPVAKTTCQVGATLVLAKLQERVTAAKNTEDIVLSEILEAELAQLKLAYCPDTATVTK